MTLETLLENVNLLTSKFLMEIFERTSKVRESFIITFFIRTLTRNFWRVNNDLTVLCNYALGRIMILKNGTKYVAVTKLGSFVKFSKRVVCFFLQIFCVPLLKRMPDLSMIIDILTNELVVDELTNLNSFQ